MCPEFPNTPAKFKATIKKTTPMEFHLSGEGETPYPMGDNIMVELEFCLDNANYLKIITYSQLHFVAETYENNQWNQLIKLDEKDPCQLLNDYVAEQWHALEKQMNIPVGVCPIAKVNRKNQTIILITSYNIILQYCSVISYLLNYSRENTLWKIINWT